MRIKMYADGADLEAIRRLNSDPNVSGFTTNPTLMRKAKITDYLVFAQEVSELVFPKSISLEVFSDTIDEMREQAVKLREIGDNVYVKIPVTNTQGEKTTDLVHELSQLGVKLNVTAIFTDDQVLDVASALEGGAPSIVSVFAGRIADAGIDPVPLMTKYANQISKLDGMELLWASPREILNLVQANDAGCDIITMSPELFEKIPNLGKSLDSFSLETVKMFFDDAVASGYKI
jgi:transaldolase